MYDHSNIKICDFYNVYNFDPTKSVISYKRVYDTILDLRLDINNKSLIILNH